MSIFKKFIIGFVSVLFLISCTSFGIRHLAGLEKGMSVNNVINIIPVEPVLEIYDFNLEGFDGKFGIQVFRLSIGETSNDFLLSYKNGKLVYWGYPHEYARSLDPLLNKLVDYYNQNRHND